MADRGGSPIQSSQPIIKDIENLLKKNYADYLRDDNEKFIDGIQSFVSRIPMNANATRLLQDCARTVHSLFQFQEVSIGVRSPLDGKYRYEAFSGYTREAENEFRRCAYTYEQFFSPIDFPSIRVTKFLDMKVAENQPSLEKEKKCWNRPMQLMGARKSAEDFTEGDYLDVFMFESGKDLLGWIEVSAPRDGKMPSGQTMRGLELFASIISMSLQLIQRKQGGFA